MSTKQSTVDYILDQLSQTGSIGARKMFGEYGLYYNEKIVGLICDDQLFIKPSPGNEKFAEHCTEAPPYPSAKNYLLVSEDLLEDRQWLGNFIKHTAAALPAKKSRK